MRNDEIFSLPEEWHNNVAYKPWIFDICEDFLLFCIFYPAVALILFELEKNNLAYFKAALLLPVFIALTASRRLARNVFYNVLFDSIVVAGMFFLPFAVSVRLVLAFAALLDAIYATSKLTNEIKSRQNDIDYWNKMISRRFLAWYMPIMCFVFLFIIYMISLSYREQTLMAICFFALITYLVTYQIYVHARGNRVLRDWEKAELTAATRNFTVFFSALLLLGFGAVSFIVYKIVYLTGLNKFDNTMLYYFTHGRPVKNDTLPEVVNKVKPQFDEGKGIRKLPKLPKDYSLFARIFNELLMLAITVFLVICVVVFLRWLFKLIMRRQRSRYEETQSIFSLREMADSFKSKWKAFSGLSLLQGATNSIKIRRLYYKAVFKPSNYGEDIAQSDTPTEISEKVKDKVSGDICSATGLYEKARYAKDDCTPEDVKAAKLYLQQKKGAPI